MQSFVVLASWGLTCPSPYSLASIPPQLGLFPARSLLLLAWTSAAMECTIPLYPCLTRQFSLSEPISGSLAQGYLQPNARYGMSFNGLTESNKMSLNRCCRTDTSSETPSGNDLWTYGLNSV